METIYLIETKNDKLLRWRFEEVHTKSEYGNGKYAIIVNLDTSELIAYVDVRYHINFNFETFCVGYIEGYFKKNLERCYKED